MGGAACVWAVSACAPSPVPPPSSAPSASLTSAQGGSIAQGAAVPVAAPAALAPAFVELGAPNHAVAGGAAIEFDGAAAGLAWPSLAHAFATRAKPGDRERVVIAAPRTARVLDVLRAAWTLRDADVEVQTFGPGDEVRALVLVKRPAAPAEAPTCHAAVFVSPEGRLRVAQPGGSVPVKDAAELVHSIAMNARSCDLRWIAFGGETATMAWGWVFDVASAVELSRAAPRARFVLGEPAAKR
jgi:hypothetical protein